MKAVKTLGFVLVIALSLAATNTVMAQNHHEGKHENRPMRMRSPEQYREWMATHPQDGRMR